MPKGEAASSRRDTEDGAGTPLDEDRIRGPPRKLSECFGESSWVEGPSKGPCQLPRWLEIGSLDFLARFGGQTGVEHARELLVELVVRSLPVGGVVEGTFEVVGRPRVRHNDLCL